MELGATGLSDRLTLHVARLLDMPIMQGQLGRPMTYRIRAYDSEMRELMSSRDITAPLAKSRQVESETIDVPPQAGILQLRTDSNLIWVQVDLVDLTGSDPVGRCKIHRLDLRSKQVWPYVLSDQNGRPRNSGIELSVTEQARSSDSSPVGSMTSLPQHALMNQSLVPPPVPVIPVPLSPRGQMVPFAPPPLSPGASTNGLVPPKPPMFDPMMNLPAGHLHRGVMQQSHSAHTGLVGLVTVHSIKDIPYPKDESMHKVRISVSTDLDGKHVELQSIGDFPTQSAHMRREKQICDVEFGSNPRMVTVKAPIQFGHPQHDAIMRLYVSVMYVSEIESGKREEVGHTVPIECTFMAVDHKYMELKSKKSLSVLGGIFLTYRICHQNNLPPAAPQPNQELVVAGAEAAEVKFEVSGRTGNFPEGSPQEADEWASINLEVQNRAMLQRSKILDRDMKGHSGKIHFHNGYRHFADLDAVFQTMGPNPLTMDPLVGATCARGYMEPTDIVQEVGPQIGSCTSPHDLAVNWQLLEQVYKEDPRRQHTMVRPVVCKDPEYIATKKDLTWMPKKPEYVPMRHFSPEDIETLRLSCYDPSTSAALWFSDVNPAYAIREDIWGAQHSYKKHGTQCHTLPPQLKQHRLKDECPIA